MLGILLEHCGRRVGYKLQFKLSQNINWKNEHPYFSEQTEKTRVNKNV